MAEKNAPETESSKEKRVHLRFPVTLPIDFGKADYYLSSICSNLSQNGLFIETSQQFAIGERVCLFVSLPNQADPIKLIGEVVRISGGESTDLDGRKVNGIGIRFVGENPEGDQLLKGLMNSSQNGAWFKEEEPTLLVQ